MKGQTPMMINVTINSTWQQTRHNDFKHSDVTDLRQRLLALGVWPEAGDEFLALLPGSRWHSPPLIEEDTHWVKLAARDALRGQDIGAYYPAFFQKLITNANLRQAFLEELDRLPDTTNGKGH
jgi:hypothetical protein